MFDWIPGIIKSVCQLARGDIDGAIQTQVNFLVSKVSTSTQLKMDPLFTDIESIPIVGHVAGAIQYAFGDRKGGAAAIKKATHATGVWIGGCLGSMAFGSVGAKLGGAVGGILADTCITIYDSKTKGGSMFEHPYGIIKNIQKIMEPELTLETLENAIEIGESIHADSNKGSQAVKKIESLFEITTKPVKFVDDDKTTNKEKKDIRKNFEGDINSQSNLSNADVSGDVNNPSKSSKSDVPENLKKQPKSSKADVPENLKKQPKSSKADVPGDLKKQTKSSKADVPGDLKKQTKSSKADVPENLKKQPKSSKADVLGDLKMQPKSSKADVPENIKKQPKSSKADVQSDVKKPFKLSNADVTRDTKNPSKSTKADVPADVETPSKPSKVDNGICPTCGKEHCRFWIH